MGITANTFDMRTIPSAGKDWHVSLQTEDGRLCEEIKAAESGFSHYITKLRFRVALPFGLLNISIGSGETASAVTTVHFGPIPLKGPGLNGKFDWKAPRGMGIKCTSGLSITIDSTAGETLWVEAHGKTCKD